MVVLALGASLARADVLDDLLATALTHNPDVLRARAELQSALARVPQAAALPNPSLSAETMGSDLIDGEQTFRLSQSFPWPGTRGERESAASRKARAFRHEVHAIELEVAARVRAIAAEYAYLQKESGLVGRNLQLFRKQEDFLEQAARSGGDVSELPRVEIESGMLEDDLARLDEERLREAAELEALVGQPIDRSRLAALDLMPPATPERDATALAAELRRRNPTLLALASRVDAAEAGVEIARLEAWPEWMVDAGYRRVSESGGGETETMNEAVLMLSMTLPLWSAKNQGQRDEAGAMLEAARREYDAAVRMREAELGVVLSRERDALRRVTLYRDRLMPKALQSHDAVETAYRAGNAGLLDLFSERRRLLETETRHWRALADLHVSQAKIDALFGADQEQLPQ
jgi:outer membrane protein TolC